MWWYSTESGSRGVFIVQVGDDGTATIGLVYGSYEIQMWIARWNLQGDVLTFTPVRSLDGDDRPSTVQITFEDDTLVISEPENNPVLTMYPGPHPEADLQGNTLSGTVTYSDGPYDEIVVLAYRFEDREGSDNPAPVIRGASALLVEGQWRISGLDDGDWSVEAIVLKYSGGSVRIPGDGDLLEGKYNDVLIGTLSDGTYTDESGVGAKTPPPDPENSFSLEGGQVVTGVDLVPMPTVTAVDTATWGKVKRRSR